nr:hypothetical protein [Nonomuraea lactucae]
MRRRAAQAAVFAWGRAVLAFEGVGGGELRAVAGSRELAALIDKGVVEVEADARLLESLADVHRAAERGTTRGKIILKVEK